MSLMIFGNQCKFCIIHFFNSNYFSSIERSMHGAIVDELIEAGKFFKIIFTDQLNPSPR